jgi:agmatinase
VIDPLGRWSAWGEKPDYAGLLTFAGVPYTEDVGDLSEAAAVVVGAPFDDLTSDRPGTRNGPRAIRAAGSAPGHGVVHGVDALAALRVVDFGDAPVRPGDVEASHRAIRDTVALVLAAGAIPVVLGGDHSISEPTIQACVERHGIVGVVHFDTHTDTGTHVYGVSRSHGTMMRSLVESGAVDPLRYVQIGLRGYWPPPEDFAWQSERGITHFTTEDVVEHGIGAVVERAVAVVGGGPTYVTVDVDVLDPAYAPGTGTPEPGGLTSRELLQACRRVAASVDVVGLDVVEVAPIWPGTLDTTALVADRAVRELLTGVALARASR